MGFKRSSLIYFILISSFIISIQQSTSQYEQMEIISSEGNYTIDGSRSKYDRVEFDIGGDLIIDSIKYIEIVNSILNIDGELTVISDGNIFFNNKIKTNLGNSNFPWGIFLKSSSFNTFDNNTIQNDVNNVFRIGSIISNVFYTGSDNNIISNNLIKFKGVTPIDTFNSHNNEILNNVFEFVGINQYHGEIEVTSANNWYIYGNRGDIGITVNGGTNNVTIDNNIFTKYSIIECTENIIIKNNQFTDTKINDYADFALSLTAYQYSDASLDFYNNTVYGINNAIVFRQGRWTDVYLYNNSFTAINGFAFDGETALNFRLEENTILGEIANFPSSSLLIGNDKVISGSTINDNLSIITRLNSSTPIVIINGEIVNIINSTINKNLLQNGENLIRLSVADELRNNTYIVIYLLKFKLDEVKSIKSEKTNSTDQISKLNVSDFNFYLAVILINFISVPIMRYLR